jgi:hypothetical protein
MYAMAMSIVLGAGALGALSMHQRHKERSQQLDLQKELVIREQDMRARPRAHDERYQQQQHYEEHLLQQQQLTQQLTQQLGVVRPLEKVDGQACIEPAADQRPPPLVHQVVTRASNAGLATVGNGSTFAESLAEKNRRSRAHLERMHR